MPLAMVSQSPLRVPYAMRNAGSTAGEADVLAGEASAQHVHRIDLLPVHSGQITEIGDSGMTGHQQSADVAVIVRDPSQPATERVLDGHVQAAVASAQRAETKFFRGALLFHITSYPS